MKPPLPVYLTAVAHSEDPQHIGDSNATTDTESIASDDTDSSDGDNHAMEYDDINSDTDTNTEYSDFESDW